MIYALNNEQYKLRPVVEGETQNDITFFWGNPTSEMLDDPKTNDRTLNHEFWLRSLGSVDNSKNPVEAIFQRPATYTFSDNTPYIVSFPGSRYYEFDMTDNTITFSSGTTVIPVTSDIKTTADGYSHTGTFLHVTDAAYGMNDDGTQFSNTVNTVLPFRTYMAMATTSAPGVKAIIIGGTAENVGHGIEEFGDPSEGLNNAPQMVVYSRDHNIIIESDYADNVHIYSASGQLIRAVKVYEGSNLYSGFESGVYIINGKKLFVK